MRVARSAISRPSEVSRTPLGPRSSSCKAELVFEFLDLHRQRGLGDGAMYRGPTEVAEAGNGIEVAQLLEGGHGI